MPIIIGDARVVTIRQGTRDVQVFVWPKSVADEVAIEVAKEAAESQVVRSSYAVATYIQRMARKSDGTALYGSMEATMEQYTSDDLLAAFEAIRATEAAMAEAGDPGNP